MDTKVYLQEAFKALDMLNEEDFNIDTLSGQEDFKDFQIEDEEKPDFIDVMDTEASDEEDVQDSYVGKLILDCCVCHNKFYKDESEVEFSEDEEVVNEDEECPYCYSTDGFKIIGMVAPFVPSDEDEDAEVDIEVKDDFDTNTDDEDVDEPIDESCKGKNCRTSKRRGRKVEEGVVGTLIGGGIAGGKLGDKIGDKWLDKANEEFDDEDYDDTLDEDFERVEIETDRERMEMTADENGKVIVSTEPKAETVAPVSDEIQSRLNPIEEPEFDNDMGDFSDEDEFSEEGEEYPEDDEIVDMDEFSEEDFDNLGESYLKRIYENVRGYRTTNVSKNGNKVVVEGIINFTSGKTKKTSFIFEAIKMHKNRGSVKLIGENAQITRGRKAFTVAGKVNKGKFIAESFNYNYRAKDNKGMSTRIYGTLKNKK